MPLADHQAQAASFRTEQHELHHKIDEWTTWWNELSQLGEPRFGEMRDRVEVIRDRLETHFHHEEESELYRETSAIKPQYAQLAEQLVSEHRELLDRLRELCTTLAAPEPQFATWGDAKSSFQEFLNELEEHEKQENKLIDLWTKQKPSTK